MVQAYTDTEWARDNVDKFFNGWLAGVLYLPLKGHCVSLVKYYLKKHGVADWKKARGNAKDFGNALVAEGLAVKVSTRRKGDIAVWPLDGGGYGHIGVVVGATASSVFEENVAVPSARKGWFGFGVRYASGIHPLNAGWRVGKPVFYRLKK